MKCTLCSLVLVVFSLAAFGQTITGTITGTVMDASGAVVPNAKVVATNTQTNLTYPTETNSAGIYTLVFLPVGNYTVLTEAQGFKKSSAGPFKLEVTQVARVDVVLQVGQLTETVEIKDVAPVLQTEGATTGGTLSSTSVVSVPLKGRNFASLTLLVPGAITTNPQSFEGIGRNGTDGRPFVNGNRQQTNNFLLDGADINESANNTVGYAPNVDALQEVQVITGNAGAEFGNANGAIVNMTLKSGTNEFHGNLFEFLQNDKLNANGFFNNRSNVARNALRRNIWGGTFGGPVIKNKLFFFVDYQGARQRTSGPASASLAPDAWRTGDLSSLKKSIKDPTTNQPFPDAVIPASRIVNPAAKALFSDAALYPHPNNVGTGTAGQTNNYIGTSASFSDNDQADAKVDYNIGEKDSLSSRFTIGRARSGPSAVITPVTILLAADSPTTGGVTTWTRVFSPTLVNEARLNFNRVRTANPVMDVAGLLGRDGNQKLGIPGGQPVAGVSRIAMGDGLSDISTNGTASDGLTNTYQFSDNLTKQFGRHMFKMGAQALRYQQNRFYSGDNGVLGYFTYDGRYTTDSFADFLLDYLGAKGRGSATGMWGHRQWRTAFFFEDGFKVTPNLTLNLGLRWEYSQPLYEVADRQLNVNIYTGAVSYAGKDGASRALYNGYWKQFMPRVGFAWSPGILDRKLVVRGAYGITSFLEGTGSNLRLPMNPPYFYESSYSYSTSSPGTITSGFTGMTANSGLAGQARAWNEDLRPAFIQQYNFSIEYQVAPTMSVTAAYVGQSGTHLINPREGNQAPLGSTNINASRPLYKVLPDVTTISFTDSSARMNYNALQLGARKRLSKGLEFVASYTLSKAMTDNTGFYGSSYVDAASVYWQDAYNRHAEWGPAFFNALHNVSFGGSYELPVGKGRPYFTDMPRIAEGIFGGWQLGYIFSAHSGFPITITSSNNSNAGNRTARANRYRPLVITDQSVDHWFGTDASATPCTTDVDNGVCAYGKEITNTFGTAGVGTERAPAFSNFDMTVGKRFSFTERRYLEFRTEFFNVFNMVSFSAPARVATSSDFGQITAQVNSPRTIQFGLKFYF
jgi:hypothetical protein